MCSAGGGDSKLYRLLFPLNPDEVVWCSCKSFILDNLPFSFEDDSIVFHPGFPIPDLHPGSYFLYGDKTGIGEYE